MIPFFPALQAPPELRTGRAEARGSFRAIRSRRSAWGIAACWAVATLVAGCGDVWTDPLSTPLQYDKGLIVMYPGALVSDSEMLGFWTGLRFAGIDQAIEVQQWTPPLSNEIDPIGTYQLNRETAVVEAGRIADYVRAHPHAPVTLFGYSAGSMYAMMVAAELPADAPVDQLILLSSSVSHKYDIAPALNRSRGGAVAYWSPNEFTIRLLLALIGNTDLTRDPAAAYTGFDSNDARLTQICWTPDMLLRYGHIGEHSAYIFNLGWIIDYLAPHVPRSKP